MKNYTEGELSIPFDDMIQLKNEQKLQLGVDNMLAQKILLDPHLYGASVDTSIKAAGHLWAWVALGVFGYTEVTARLTSLETSRELFENDLLKKSEQVPTDQEQHFLIEDLYKSVEKMEETQEMNMTNKVNIEFLREQLDKALTDIEELKDKVRANGNGGH